MRIGTQVFGQDLYLLNRLSRDTSTTTSSVLSLYREVNARTQHRSALLALSNLQLTQDVSARGLSNSVTASNSLSRLGLTLDRVRTELSTIRARAAEDQDQQLSDRERADNQAAIDAAIERINLLAGSGISGIPIASAPSTGDSVLTVSEIDQSQLVDFDVDSIDGNTSQTLTATVTAAAEQAELTYVGSAGGLVTDTATFTLTGSLGSLEVSIAKDESLADVRDRINLLTSSTGVAASLSADNLVFNSVDYGSGASLSVGSISAENITISGANASQLLSFDVDSIDSDSSQIVSGTVTTDAEQAQLTYAGAAGGLVTDTATFTVAGRLGIASVSITKGESLADVRDRINLLTSSTGVAASLSGDDLVFNTVHFGSTTNLSVNVTEIDDVFTVSGDNASQLVSFNIDSMAPNSSQIISGTVTTAAEQAQLTYVGGVGGLVTDTATFTLTGSLGNASISIAKDESLADVRDRINLLTSSTGVTASLSGDDLVFNTTDFGSSANFSVEVTAIDNIINVSGVNGSQLVSFNVDSMAPNSSQVVSGTVTAAAEQAQLQLHGNKGEVKFDATFTVAGNAGSVDFSVTKGDLLTDVRDSINLQTEQTGVTASVSGDYLVFDSVGYGSAATVSVQVTAGKATVSGGNSDGTANGTDAQATINGQNLTGSGNQFTVTDGAGTFTMEFAAGFSGAFDPVTAESVNGVFDVTGGNGDSTANGTDAQATINGQNLTGTGNQFTITDGSGTFTMEFAAGFSGGFDAVTASHATGQFDLTGGNGDSTANGTDALATINGQSLTGDGNRFTFSDASGSYTLEFAPGFTGASDPVTVSNSSSSSPLQTQLTFVLSVDPYLTSLSRPGLQAASLGGSTGTLDQLASGGSKAGLGSSAADAVRIADEALADLTRIERMANAFSAVVTDSLSQLWNIGTADEASQTAFLARELALDVQSSLETLYSYNRLRIADLLTS